MSKTYTLNRCRPVHEGAWDSTKTYLELSVVYDPATGNSYTSRTMVPAGTLLTNTTYWVKSSDYNSQLVTVPKFYDKIADMKADNSLTVGMTAIAKNNNAADNDVSLYTIVEGIYIDGEDYRQIGTSNLYAHLITKLNLTKHIAENEQEFLDMKAYVDSQISAIDVSGGGSSDFPKGVYSTLAELQTAYPTGTSGVFFVLEDGKWYYWTNQWLAGGVFGTSIGENLFDKTKVTQGKYLDTYTGAETSSTDYFISDYIAATPNTHYAATVASFIGFYNATKQFISGVLYSNTSGYFTTPNNTAFIKISNNNLETVLVEGDTINQSYSVSLFFDAPPVSTHTVTVKAGGTPGTNCDFTSIKSALDSITTNSKNNKYTVKVLNGTYEVNGTGANYFGLKPYVDIVGQSKTGVIVKHTAPIMDDTKATFDVAYYPGFNGECTLKNMTIISYNCKAPIHADIEVTNFRGTINVMDCILINNNKFSGSSNHNCAAFGLRPGQHIYIKNCLANGFMWSHNSTVDSSDGASFIVENCICEYLWVATLGGKANNICQFIRNKCEYIKIGYADYMGRSGTDSFEMSWSILLEGNDFNYLITLYEGSIGNVLGDFWDELFNGVYAITDSSIHDYCYNNTGAMLAKGTYVDMPNKITKEITTATDQSKAYGVVLKNIPAGAYGVVQYKGDFAKALTNG